MEKVHDSSIQQPVFLDNKGSLGSDSSKVAL